MSLPAGAARVPMVFASSVCFGRRGLAELLDAAAAAGVRGVELGAGVLCAEPPLPVLERAVREHGLALRIHNYFPPPAEPFVLNLASDDEIVARRSMALCREALTLCAEFGIPYYSVHAGFCVRCRPKDLGRGLAALPRIDPGRARENFVRRTRELARMAGDLGMMLAIENNVAASMNLVDGQNHLLLGASGREMVELLEDVGGSDVGALVDVGHLHVSARAMGFDFDEALALLAGRALAAHVSANDGLQDQHRPLARGDMFCAAAARLPAHVERILEVRDLGAGELKEQLGLLFSGCLSESGG